MPRRCSACCLGASRFITDAEFTISALEVTGTLGLLGLCGVAAFVIIGLSDSLPTG